MLLTVPEDEDGLAFRLTLLTHLGFRVVSKPLVQKCLGERELPLRKKYMGENPTHRYDIS